MTASRPLSFLLILLGLLCVLTTAPARASSQDLLGSLGIETQPRFLKVDQAFALESEQQGDRLLLRIRIADGYYLYRHSIRVKGENLAFDEPVLPPGTEHEDDFFGKSRVYYQEVQIPVALTRVGDTASLTLSYQGCTEGLCYPPTDKRIAVEPLTAPAQAEAVAPLQGTDVPGSQQDRLAAALGSQGFWISVAAFFALGLGLAFTPCVFPMYPILTGIIAGAGHRLSTRRAFLLSFVYVQGMAVTYTLLGLVVASAGLQFQAALQHSYVLIGLSVMFVLLALSMFGLYTLQLPSSLQTRLSGFSNRQQGGSVAGVAIMGMISGLVCSPCTTAPLTGALLYVAQSGDRWLGGAALYALSLGMGLPLLLLATFGKQCLPRNGLWMQRVKVLFGFILLAVPLLLLERLLPTFWLRLGWLLLAGSALSYLALTLLPGPRWRLSALLLIALLARFGWQQWPAEHQEQLAFASLQSPAQLQQELQAAEAAGMGVVVDFYADWCVACKQLEQETFSDPAVQQRLQGYRRLRVDVTVTTEQERQLMAQLKVPGLPAMLFFQPAEAQPSTRIDGFLPPEGFVRALPLCRPEQTC